MPELRAFPASEELDARSPVRQVQMGEAVKLRGAFISDQYHPRVVGRGESSFAPNVIGAVSTATSLQVTSGTRPTIKCLDAGFDQVRINQRGPEQEPTFSLYTHEPAPRLGL